MSTWFRVEACFAVQVIACPGRQTQQYNPDDGGSPSFPWALLVLSGALGLGGSLLCDVTSEGYLCEGLLLFEQQLPHLHRENGIPSILMACFGDRQIPGTEQVPPTW